MGLSIRPNGCCLRIDRCLSVRVTINYLNEAGEHYKATGVYTDGGMSENGWVGAGLYVEGGGKPGGATLGKIATVWDGEVCGVRGALEGATKRISEG